MTETPHEIRLRKTRSKLLRRSPYWGGLAFNLKFQVTTDTETADIDGVTLRVNPDYLDTLDPEEALGMMAHELSHVSSGDIARRGNREMPLWNQVTDWNHNDALRAAGFKLPKGALFMPDEYKGKDLSSEALYGAEMRKRQGNKPQQGAPKPQQGQGAPQPASGGAGSPPPPPAPTPAPNPADRPGADPGRCGGIKDAPIPEGADTSTPQAKAKAQEAANKASASDWKQRAIIAAMSARGIGKMDGADEAHIKHEGRALIDWKAALRHFLLSQIPDDYTAPPFHKGLLAALKLPMPDAAPTTCGPVAIIVDTSGSQWGDIERFGPEIAAVMGDAEPERCTVIYNDTAPRHIDTFEQGDPITITARGGGGTAYAPAFDWIAEHTPDIIGAIVLGDMDNDSWPEPTPYPVLWVSTTHVPAPARLGETIHLDTD